MTKRSSIAGKKVSGPAFGRKKQNGGQIWPPSCFFLTETRTQCPRDDRSNLGRSGFRMYTVYINIHIHTTFPPFKSRTNSKARFESNPKAEPCPAFGCIL
jgi:hypothetical protein